ncbi:hypothetical protein [Photorhabdus luminescens]|uniref:hypothetical protein n=1 Tax=Photorhabdus luminescens TaxID=29488 RepID=UPI001864B207|nr:hypothetical protein [Photorhabdus luminescens]
MLQTHYGPSTLLRLAPPLVPRIGTLALMGPPLAFLPSHRGDRFPRSPQEPESTSRRLYAGCRAGSKQVAPCAYPTGTTPPWF